MRPRTFQWDGAVYVHNLHCRRSVWVIGVSQGADATVLSRVDLQLPIRVAFPAPSSLGYCAKPPRFWSTAFVAFEFLAFSNEDRSKLEKICLIGERALTEDRRGISLLGLSRFSFPHI